MVGVTHSLLFKTASCVGTNIRPTAKRRLCVWELFFFLSNLNFIVTLIVDAPAEQIDVRRLRLFFIYFFFAL